MLFEWDEAKSEKNRLERGFGYDFPALIFEGPIIEWCDIREAWGESRIAAVGEADGIVVTLVYTDRGDTAPHIGALRANEGTQIVAIPHKSLKEIRASKPKVDRAKIRATTQSAIRRHMIEVGEGSDIELETRDVFAPANLSSQTARQRRFLHHRIRFPLAPGSTRCLAGMTILGCIHHSSSPAAMQATHEHHQRMRSWVAETGSTMTH